MGKKTHGLAVEPLGKEENEGSASDNLDRAEDGSEEEIRRTGTNKEFKELRAIISLRIPRVKWLYLFLRVCEGRRTKAVAPTDC
jgi:hypothetical protein